MKLPWKICEDFDLEPCYTCRTIVSETACIICHVEWYAIRLRTTSIKDYIRQTIKEDNVEPTHDYYYLEAAIRHHFPEQLEEFHKLMVLI